MDAAVSEVKRREDQSSELDRIVRRLHLAGWSCGGVVVRAADGSPAWLVTGTNGENLIRAEGATQAEVWRLALEQARAVGMLDGRRPRLAEG